MIQTTKNEQSVLVISRRLSADVGFRYTLAHAGVILDSETSGTKALQNAMWKKPSVVVVELADEPAADESLLEFADEYTRQHEATVILLSKNAVPTGAFQGVRAGSIRWVDSDLCGDDCLAHVVVDAVGCLHEFDRECEARFLNQKTA